MVAVPLRARMNNAAKKRQTVQTTTVVLVWCWFRRKTVATLLAQILNAARKMHPAKISSAARAS
jgi:hypothetical protein